MASRSLGRIAAYALIMLGIVRGCTVLFAEPLIATANNYDMIRVQACINAYPLRDASIPPWANSYLAPIEKYAFRGDVGAPCFLTSEALFAFLALPAMFAQSRVSADGSFSIRWVGLVKYLALIGFAIFATRLLLPGAGAVAHAAIFFLVLNDPGVTIYLQTFYAEFSALFLAYVMVLAVLLEVARAAPRSIAWSLLLIMAPALLALSKVQHIVTPWIILFAAGLVLLVRRDAMQRKALCLLVAGAVLGTVAQLAHLRSEQTATMGRANIVNTVFYGLLENSSDPARTLVHLGLPPACSASIGKNWFSPGMQEGTLCPEIIAVSRPDVARALLLDPAMGWRTVVSGIPRMNPWVPRYLGLVEGQELGRLPQSTPSLSSAVSGVTPGGFLVGFTVVVLACSVGGWLWLRQGRLVAGCAAVVFGVCPVPLLATVVLGDGYADTAKQSHLAFALLLCAAILLALMAIDAAVRATERIRARPG